MANEKRVRALAVGGLVEDNPLTPGAVALNSAGLAALPGVGTTEHAAIILDPDGMFGAPEVAWVTAHTAGLTTCTLARGQEGTTARQHDRDVPWVHGSTLREQEAIGVSVCSSVTTNTIAHNTWTGPMAYDTEMWDTHGFHDLVANTGRLTIPVGLGGWYLLDCSFEYAPNGTGSRHLAVLRNTNLATDVGAIGAGYAALPGFAGAPSVVSVVRTVYLNDGDWLVVNGFQDSGVALVYNGNGGAAAASQYRNCFQLTKLAK